MGEIVVMLGSQFFVTPISARGPKEPNFTLFDLQDFFSQSQVTAVLQRDKTAKVCVFPHLTTTQSVPTTFCTDGHCLEN